MAVYEERRVVVQPGAFAAYRTLVLDSLWPQLESAGARPLCLLNGLIGAPAEETYLFTGFPDLDSWRRGQELLTGASPDSGTANGLMRQREQLIVEEHVRLLSPSHVRPKSETPTEDRRALYSLRRWWIAPEAWPDFVRYSHEAVWPAMDYLEHMVLGLFRTAATTDPLEVTILTGYHGSTHWRTRASPPLRWRPCRRPCWRGVGSWLRSGRRS